jgi:hypothetical protein
VDLKRGAPRHIRADNGPEMISKTVKSWCKEGGTGTLHIDPGSPWQNGIVESFNGRLRGELLSSEIFDTLAETTYLVHRWRMFHNHRHIQRALGKRTPAAFAARCPPAPARKLAPLARAACRSAGHGPLRSSQSHNGWTDESDPVRRHPRVRCIMWLGQTTSSIE